MLCYGEFEATVADEETPVTGLCIMMVHNWSLYS